MTNTAIRLHLVRTITAAPAAHDSSQSWDVTVGSEAEAHQHLAGYRDEENWVTATAETADGAWLGSGRAGFGEVRSDWA